MSHIESKASAHNASVSVVENPDEPKNARLNAVPSRPKAIARAFNATIITRSNP